MYIVTFYEKSALVMSKLTTILPSVDEKITVKGRKGTVIKVDQIDERKIDVYVEFEKVVKKQVVIDDKKKKR
ncbi:hypothetical protein CD30_18120 [Ureibacillus massiliensis 4400831 = CIP 108448 = CCUG 49529]|uniref:Uncharacterized protein n=1 Tax=Ureibacillus massiliensis 4400831 = CIP 108448 = CCUG 49529 TaxID=1211035 RepID=A0A0A3IV74_9BACL|nr:hypothetical protein [Ureibacillus massiliensis]KGR88626.1 hypothetical protein CD30_18120 [Ureibacillus massiliensis 4400831 = CIP 108448 = CCUG 49529]